MSEPLATPDDIKGGQLSGAARRAAESLIEQAEATLGAEVSSLHRRIDEGDLDPVLPRGVIVRMVTDALNHGDRLRAETIGETRFEYDVAALREFMEPTAKELARLRPKSKKRRGPVGTIHTRSTI